MTQLFVFGRPAPKPRQVAVVGSRDYRRLDLVRDFALQLPEGSTVLWRRAERRPDRSERRSGGSHG